jgi:hypothetical protein
MRNSRSIEETMHGPTILTNQIMYCLNVIAAGNFLGRFQYVSFTAQGGTNDIRSYLHSKKLRDWINRLRDIRTERYFVTADRAFKLRQFSPSGPPFPTEWDHPQHQRHESCPMHPGTPWMPLVWSPVQCKAPSQFSPSGPHAEI